ncbi:MAG: hypothetical protein VCA36_01125 [Opitutales bacterium]
MNLKTANISLLVLSSSVFILSGCADDEPVHNETSEQKQKEVADSFTGESVEDGSKHAKDIRKFFDQFPLATGSNDFAKVNQLFDMGMLFRLLNKQDLAPAKIQGREKIHRNVGKSDAPPILRPGPRHSLRAI